MKSLFVIFGIFALAYADTDWSQVKWLDYIDGNVIQRDWNERITNGHESIPHSRPYIVGLLLDFNPGTAFCGGALISTTYVLTAAHCAEPSVSATVILGAHNISDPTEPTQVRIHASNKVVHENWHQILIRNDIALIIMDQAVTLNAYIQLSKLPTWSIQDDTFVSQQAVEMGWGLPSDNDTTVSDVLNEVEMPVISNAACSSYYQEVIVDSMICTSSYEGKSTCSGDSGSPLILVSNDNTRNNTQIGIVSFGISLGCENNFPSAFTRVTSFLPWIQDNSGVTILP